MKVGKFLKVIDREFIQNRQGRDGSDIKGVCEVGKGGMKLGKMGGDELEYLILILLHLFAARVR